MNIKVYRANSISRIKHNGPNAVRSFPDAKTFVFEGHLFGFSPSAQTIIATSTEAAVMASRKDLQMQMIMQVIANN